MVALTKWADLIPPPSMKGNGICSARSVTRFSVAATLSLRIALFAASSVANQSQNSALVRVTIQHKLTLEQVLPETFCVRVRGVFLLRRRRSKNVIHISLQEFDPMKHYQTFSQTSQQCHSLDPVVLTGRRLG